MEKSVVSISDRVSAQVIRERILKGEFDIKGTYRLEHYRNGELIGTYESHNLATTEGKRHLLSVVFSAGTASGTWYVALVSNAGTPAAPAVGQVYDTFFDSVNAEYINYSSATRVTWVEVLDGALAKITNTASKAAFTFDTSSGSVYGACLVNVNTKSDHGVGTLMSFSAFGSPISVEINDVVNVEIELSFT